MLGLMNKSPRQLMQQFIGTSGGKMLEALAGSGNLDQARGLLEILKNLDSSEETLGKLRQHLKRAGHEELLDESLPHDPPEIFTARRV
jgi:uncharacterized protein YidB (DUF937 family)